MRTIVGATLLLLLLTACSGSGSEPSERSQLSSADAAEQTCAEVRAGIDDFNRQDYRGTVEHFEKARVTAEVYATVNTEPEADDLLDAVQYYADLAPADYPGAARSSESFARNKAITLEQCAEDGPSGGDAPTPV